MNNVAWSNARVDSRPESKFDTRYHFEAEQLEAAQQLLGERYNLLVNSLKVDEAYLYGRELLGVSLHAIQVNSIPRCN